MRPPSLSTRLPDIILSTINARYVHTALGLRYLHANMGELQARTRVIEFVLGARASDMAEQLLAHAPKIMGFGVYIWNVEETAKVVALLKRIAPEVIIVLGGPEVSYETEEQRIVQLADYVITGWGDVSFAQLCRELLAGARPSQKIISGEQPELSEIRLPYALYSDEDVSQRFIYVEASRGCPYKCEFCLSALDKTAWPFDLDAVLAQLDALYRRGARHFRFVDRTFNLKVSNSVRILEFFLARMDENLFVHFEVIPDHLPDALKAAITRFPKGALQFEVGIQTWNPQVQALISRRQDNDKAEANIRWLRVHSNALIHADLIAGLPGEDLASFARGFDRMVEVGPHEIQLGILKRLRGTPIARHTQAYGMRYNPDPPYNVLATDRIDFPTMQRINRFARYWELVANSGRFARSLPLLLGEQPFECFLAFSDWLYARTGQTHAIALERLYDRLHAYFTASTKHDAEAVTAALLADYAASGAKGRLSFAASSQPLTHAQSSMRRSANRQARHYG